MTRPRRRPDLIPLGALIVAGGIVTILLGWAALFQHIENEQAAAIHAAELANTNLVHAFKEHVQRVASDVDLQSANIAAEIELRGHARIDLPARQRRLKATIPYIMQIAVLGPSGTLAASSMPLPPTPVQLGATEHFQHHAASTSERLFVARPIQSHFGPWTIPMTRRLSRPDGSFAGVLVLSIDPEYFARFFGGTSVGENGVVTLLRSDGVVLGRRSGDSWNVGSDIREGPLYQTIRERGSGVLISGGRLDGRRRVIAFETLRGYPLMIYVGTALDVVLEPIVEKKPIYYSTASVLSGLILLGALMIALLISRQRHIEAEVRALNETLERRVQQRTAALARANKELESFAYSVSHDLRSPLRAMMGFSEIVLESNIEKLDAESIHLLKRIQTGSKRMERLIDDLLSLSRVSRREMRRADFDLTALVQKLADQIAQTEPERRARFTIEPGMVANADASLLGIALENLIGNAWKFTSRTADAQIEIGTTIADAVPVWFVRDNGAGFDMQYYGKLFEAFQRLHRADEYDGTGIGLSIVHRVIARHGGRVWAESTLGKGATFYFTLG